MPEIEIVAECKNGREAVAAAFYANADLMFLDIQMPGMNGFDVVQALQGDILPMVIFATAFDKYALDAFDVHAVDYVLKPFDEERIRRGVLRAVSRHESGQDLQNPKLNLIGAIDDISKKVDEDASLEEVVATEHMLFSGDERKLVIKDKDTINLVAEGDIDWVDAAGDYMCIHAAGVIHIIRSTMKDLEQALNPDAFKRVHRSTIVNLNRIERVIPLAKGEYVLQLGHGARIKVSRNYREAIKSFLAQG